MPARWGHIQSSGASLSRSGHWLGRGTSSESADPPVTAWPEPKPVSLASVKPKVVPAVEPVRLPVDLFRIGGDAA